MNRRTKLIATGAVAAAAIAVGSGIAVASGTEEDDPPIPQGTALDRATEVALKEAGGGTVSGSEQDDGGYEVEVTREDGSVLEVELDADFKVTGSEVDDDDGPTRPTTTPTRPTRTTTTPPATSESAPRQRAGTCVLTGPGRPNRYPCAYSQPSARSASSWHSFSTPSAIVPTPRPRARPMTALTIASSSAS